MYIPSIECLCDLPLLYLLHGPCMIDVLHIYDNEPVMLTSAGTLVDDRMAYCPCDILALYPEVIVSRPFNLIIFDVSGKETSCVAIFKKLKKWIEISGASRPPIIVIAQKDSELTEQSARMEGADFFFVKPVDMQELVTVFQQISSRNQRT